MTAIKNIKQIRWIVFYGAFVIVGVLPAISQAACPPDCPSPGPITITLQNPLATADIYTFVQSILDIVFRLGTVVAVFFIIYSGFLFITAQGDPPKLQTARKAFLWTVVGTAILLGSWLLATAIKGTIDQLKAKPSQAMMRMFADRETRETVYF